MLETCSVHTGRACRSGGKGVRRHLRWVLRVVKHFRLPLVASVWCQFNYSVECLWVPGWAHPGELLTAVHGAACDSVLRPTFRSECQAGCNSARLVATAALLCICSGVSRSTVSLLLSRWRMSDSSMQQQRQWQVQVRVGWQPPSSPCQSAALHACPRCARTC